jgi:hypothetical protein
MKIPYPIVSKKNPFFYIAVSGIDLSSITTTGDTKLQVYRVWKNTSNTDTPVDTTSLNSPPDYVSQYNVPPYYTGDNTQASAAINPVNYAPSDQKKNRFTFVFDSQLFDMDGGRYRADFYYKGTYVSCAYLEYDKDSAAIAGSANV